jgi:hypothetical protein
VSLLSFDPTVEYVALAFLGTPLAEPVTPSSVAVFVGLLALTPVGLATAERQATALWFTDAPAARTTAESASTEPTSPTHFSPPRPFAWTTPGHVAWGILVRAVRKPQEFVHLVTILFFVGPFAGTVVQSGLDSDVVPLLVAGGCVVLGAYLSGATFGLNPLGDDRPQFPLLLLTETSPEAYIRGRVVAGLAVGLPVGVVGPLLSIGLGGEPGDALAFAVAGAAASLAAALFAVGLGCLYPIYEARELWGTETVAPSMLVMLGFTFVATGGSSVGLLVLWFTLAGALQFTTVAVVGLGGYLLLTAGVPLLSYRYAVRRYRRFVFD